MTKPPRKPDWRVSTPSQLDPNRWVEIGAAWNSETDDGTAYVSVQLDVMPNTGKLSLFPRNHARSCDDKTTYRNAAAASNAAGALSKADGAHPVESYLCETCGKWHIGRSRSAE